MVIAIVLMAVILPAKAVALTDEKAATRIVPQLGHSDSVDYVTFSPSGEQILSYSTNTLKLWDTKTGALLRTFPEQNQEISSFALSQDRKFLLTYGAEVHLQLWSVETGTLLHNIGDWSLFAFSPNGKFFLTAEGRVPKVWSVETGKPVRNFKEKVDSGSITFIAFSPSGKEVASIADDASLTLWNFESGNILHHKPATAAPLDTQATSDLLTSEFLFRKNSAVFSPDGRQVASMGKDNFIRLWDVKTGQFLQKFVAPTEFTSSMSFSPDGHTLLSSGYSDDSVKLWNTSTGTLRQNFAGRFNTNGFFSPDSRKILITGDNPVLRDIDTGQPVLSLNEGSGEFFKSAAFSDDGKQVLLGMSNSQIELRDANTGKLTRKLKGRHYAKDPFTVSPDGRYILFTGLEDGTLGSKTPKLLDVVSGTISEIGDASSVLGAFSPDGKRLLLATDDFAVKLWDISTGSLLHNFTGHTDRVSVLVFSPDGRRFLSEGRKGPIKLWNCEDGALLRNFEKPSDSPPHTLSFSGDGRSILAADFSKATVWETDTGKVRSFRSNVYSAVELSKDGSRIVIRTPGVSGLYESLSGKSLVMFETESPGKPLVKFSPDGMKILIANNTTHTLEILDTKTGSRLHFLKDQSLPIYEIGFSPDGKQAFSAGADNAPMVWDVQTGSLLHSLEIPKPPAEPAKLVESGLCYRRLGAKPYCPLVEFSPLVIQRLTAVRKIVMSSDGDQMLSASDDGTVRVWNARNGILIRTFNGHLSPIRTMMFLAEGEVLSVDDTGVAILWNAETGALRGTLMSDSKGMVILTPAGFFRSEGAGNELLAIVDGYQPYKIDQFYQALYRPDLVEEYFTGDRFGKYAKAAGKLNLRHLIDSGRPPQPIIKKAEIIGNEVKMTVRLEDQGGGIGKVEWRVDGKTQGIERGVQVMDENLDTVLTRSFALEAGRNIISVTAYNSAELVASLPVETVVDAAGITIGGRGTLFVLAVGVDKYRDSSRQLKGAAADARAISEALTTAGKTTYDSVKTTIVLDENVTDAYLDKVFSQLALDIHPQDKFVFFLAGHGLTVEGKYYFLPQDFAKSDTFATKGINQDRWQEWFARINARSSVLLYDTCEAGSMARNVSTEKSAAMDRLGEASGINVISASDADQPAREGYKGHGLFTWTLLDALANGDSDQNDQIEIFELANYIGAAVPRISREEYGIEQRPRFKLLSNFPLGLRTTFDETLAGIDTTPTHFLMESVTLGGLLLEAGTEVYIIKEEGDQVIIGAEGTELGLISTHLLLKKKKLRGN